MRRRRVLEEPNINLTPLIDVVFVVLITFIVMAPLLELDRIDLAPGGETAAPATENSPLIIHVAANDAIMLNRRPVTLDELQRQLCSASKTHRPQLYHDKEARFGTYQAVKNAVEGAGFAEMDVMLKP